MRSWGIKRWGKAGELDTLVHVSCAAGRERRKRVDSSLGGSEWGKWSLEGRGWQAGPGCRAVRSTSDLSASEYKAYFFICWRKEACRAQLCCVQDRRTLGVTDVSHCQHPWMSGFWALDPESKHIRKQRQPLQVGERTGKMTSRSRCAVSGQRPEPHSWPVCVPVPPARGRGSALDNATKPNSESSVGAGRGAAGTEGQAVKTCPSSVMLLIT